ncbi:MAG: hypothetical protein M3042_10770 [Actinomycetota bacterium]|nr:hypothetical protein [Actinomycetota bacterium]
MGMMLRLCAAAAVLVATTGTSDAGAAPSPRAESTCSRHFADVRATARVTLEQLRSAGPRPVLARGAADPADPSRRFRGLPDDTPVTECLVPLGRRRFGVFLVYADGRTELYSEQNDPDHISAVA